MSAADILGEFVWNFLWFNSKTVHRSISNERNYDWLKGKQSRDLKWEFVALKCENLLVMSYHCQAESGLQLLARLSARPPLNGLDQTLFAGGPNAQDVIEISGDPSAGKTLLLTQLLLKCLLPKECDGFLIGGLNVGALFINTDHHFQIFKLVSLMENWLKNCQPSKPAEKTRIGSKTAEKIIKDSLRNLIILNCHDSMQLFVTFHSVSKILSANQNISLIAFDSASAYYWQDVMSGGIKKMDLYLKNVLKTLQKCVQEFRVVIVYTKQSYFQSKTRDGVECSSEHASGNVNQKIFLRRVETRETPDTFLAEISTPKDRNVVRYQIGSDGLNWQTS